MVNYQNGKIYKIINENNDIVYIGSTTQALSQRYQKHHHKSPNHKIILIENYPCNSKEELCKKEQQIIEQHTNLLNQVKAYRSEKDYKEYKKKYYEENKEHIKEHQKKYCEDNKKQKKSYDKKYHEENKTEILEKKKIYREENRNKINQKKKEKINCELCNCSIRKDNIKKHQQSVKCQKFQFIED